MNTTKCMCPSCGTKAKISEELIGRNVRCKKCRHRFEAAAIITRVKFEPAPRPERKPIDWRRMAGNVLWPIWIFLASLCVESWPFVRKALGVCLEVALKTAVVGALALAVLFVLGLLLMFVPYAIPLVIVGVILFFVIGFAVQFGIQSANRSAGK